jgi:hypothetical protein
MLLQPAIGVQALPGARSVAHRVPPQRALGPALRSTGVRGRHASAAGAAAHCQQWCSERPGSCSGEGEPAGEGKPAVHAQLHESFTEKHGTLRDGKAHAGLDRDGRAPLRRRLSAAEIRTIRGARVPVQCISGRQDLCAGRFWVARFARALGCPHILLGARRRGLPADAALRAPRAACAMAGCTRNGWPEGYRRSRRSSAPMRKIDSTIRHHGVAHRSPPSPALDLLENNSCACMLCSCLAEMMLSG